VDPEKLDEWKVELVDLLPWQDSSTSAAVDAESDSFFAMQAISG
jgi:hypothetical protein